MVKGYQQGDVLLKVRKELPSGVKKVAARARGYVVAEGEATGHAHVIDTPNVEMYEKNGVLWLSVKEAAEMVHEEHDVQTIEPGVYEVSQVVEVDPFENEVRAVAD